MIIAHRGFSGRHPEMTVAAYREAIDWSRDTGIPLGLECDVQFSADDELVCLHDLTVDRTSTSSGRVGELPTDQLRSLDFGSRRTPSPTPEQRGLITLRELMNMIRQARDEGVEVSLVVETKHPTARGLAVEQRVAELLTEFGWHRAGAPATVISFSVGGIKRLARLLPNLPRTFLIERDFGRWRSGRLPDHVQAAGVDVGLLREDPDFVGRALAHGYAVHAWTLNDPVDIEFCFDLGVTGFTTDYPDRVARFLASRAR